MSERLIALADAADSMCEVCCPARKKPSQGDRFGSIRGGWIHGEGDWWIPPFCDADEIRRIVEREHPWPRLEAHERVEEAAMTPHGSEGEGKIVGEVSPYRVCVERMEDGVVLRGELFVCRTYLGKISRYGDGKLTDRFRFCNEKHTTRNESWSHIVATVKAEEKIVSRRTK